ncbi:MAG: KpsF/GutQ family sugar-phosphate isomerase [Gammaproteobacteria bacterium]|nr:KpsF/GutQ family sugar-phosphate isomerase [Gammaproteobacteria bacterium]
MLASYEDAMQATGELLDHAFADAVELIANLDALLIVTGIGKSGLIGQKAVATLNSTGTRSVFVHPVEALHGDLGIVSKGTAMLAISKSGGNEETLEFVRQFQHVTTGAVITLSEANSKLAELATIALTIPKIPEIDEWDLAPTISSGTTLAICDALAICVQKAKGFSMDDFAQFHPSGTLGRRLLLSVRDLMVKGDALPLITASASLNEVVYEMSSKGLGAALLTNNEGSFFGILTDGDIRRLAERQKLDLAMSGRDCFHLSRRDATAPSVVHGSIEAQTRAFDCLERMRDAKITSLVVLENETPIGLVRMQDLVAAGL